MNRDDIIRMAREAGAVFDNDDCLDDCAIEIWARFAALVAKHTLANIDPRSFMSWQEGYAAGVTAEREACAKVCMAVSSNITLLGTAAECVNAIRARGNT